MTFAGFDPVETTTRPGRGLAIASPAIGASGLTPAVATSVLVLGALWFALLPALSGAPSSRRRRGGTSARRWPTSTTGSPDRGREPAARVPLRS
ncbi:hypothetical protein PV458_32325 [Streptomyces sp. MN03-5084-2B]|nr:hypothetical protein [Streptomyces sp. MN03-5084-2B]